MSSAKFHMHSDDDGTPRGTRRHKRVGKHSPRTGGELPRGGRESREGSES